MAALLGVFIWRTVLPARQQKSYAFSVYYTAARLALAGQAGARLCDDAWFFEQQRSLGFADRADYFCPNPPTNALAAFCLVVPLQPAGEEYHYTLLLVVILLLGSLDLALLCLRTAAIALVLSAALFALPSYFLDTARWQGWPAALLAYPRLYGALGLWAILMFRGDAVLAASPAAGGEHG